MGIDVQKRVYCRTCQHEQIVEAQDYECPRCHSEDVFYETVGYCECGAEVILYGMTNTCPGCGELYNGFGQRLKPINEWEDDW
ncbi:MAG: hypothetical protein IJ398_02015 [Clostridia bacterium]|nr:hypothetical protein [Clostridia bacterium]